MRWPPYVSPFLKHLNYNLSTFIEREKWLLTRITNTGRMYFAIEDEDGRLIGEMSLREINTRARSSRLGIHLASNKTGRGYGGEALTALLDYYFSDMRYNTMYLDVAAHNKPALQLYEKLHFEHLAPFWRVVSKDLSILDNPRYGGTGNFFRRKGPLVECSFYDMVLTRDRYYESLRDSGSTADAPREPTASPEGPASRSLAGDSP
ncbi:MAG: GNAT family N-acetyltransferase [Planctomycetota bacterium]|jgi:RimJ/RimL family protein N-acetyltransferase